MNSYEERTVAIVKHVATCVTIIIVSLLIFWNARTKHFTENGYTRQTLPGYSGAQWVLPDSNEVSK